MKCCDITIGQLREPITLAHVTRTKDTRGGWTETPATYDTPKAKVDDVSLSQRIRMGFTDERKVIKAVIRYRTDIAETDLVTVRDVTCSIVGIKNVEYRNLWLELTLQETPK